MQPDLQTDGNTQSLPKRARQTVPPRSSTAPGDEAAAAPLEQPPTQMEIAAPSEVGAMLRELEALPQAQRLHVAGSYEVYVARRAQAPECTNEIGRLREVSFRGVGEGTGNARDLDEYDNWYQHLMVWDSAAHKILGAYRLGLTESVLKEKGPEGLYCTSLFDFSPDFFKKLGPALELGRSFVRPEYQRSPRALALLWKGIGRIVSHKPRCSRLFGPVSVSNNYTESSRQLIAHELMRKEYRHALANSVNPLRPVQVDQVPAKIASQGEALTPKELHTHVAQLESSKEGLPILVREYMKLGGQFLEFSVDPDFGNAMDGLVCVDLSKTPQRLLSLYIGTDAAKQFRGEEQAN